MCVYLNSVQFYKNRRKISLIVINLPFTKIIHSGKANLCKSLSLKWKKKKKSEMKFTKVFRHAVITPENKF